MSTPLELFRSLVGRLESGRSCALCAIVNARGSTPQAGGAMLLAHDDGDVEGTIGGGSVEAEVQRQALAMLEKRSSGVLSFDLDDNDPSPDGLICGGHLEIAVESFSEVPRAEPFRKAIERIRGQQPACVPMRIMREGTRLEYRLNIEPTPTLLIAGAGHVGLALAKLAVGLDFRVVVFDDRLDLLSAERLPLPIETQARKVEAVLRQWPIDGNTYIVIVTRGHSHDQWALQAVVDSPAKYVGMIGSRRKVRMIFDELESLGVDPRKLQAVHAPIGLSIGSVTVPEIAVSIAAELIQVRRAEAVHPVEGPFEVADLA